MLILFKRIEANKLEEIGKTVEGVFLWLTDGICKEFFYFNSKL
jgi:hypothetical protein